MPDHSFDFTDALDSSGQHYVEFELVNKERLRLTRRTTEWAAGDVLRIQIRESNGHLRQGPEIPIEQLDAFLFAIVRLARG